MKIEVGKSYRTRDGQKVTIVYKAREKDVVPFKGSNLYAYSEKGTIFPTGEFQDEKDLIEEWKEPETHKEGTLIWAVNMLDDASNRVFSPSHCELKKEEGIVYFKCGNSWERLVVSDYTLGGKYFLEKKKTLADKSFSWTCSELEYPNDGRRKATLLSNSEYLCNHIKEEDRAYRNDSLLFDDVKEALKEFFDFHRLEYGKRDTILANKIDMEAYNKRLKSSAIKIFGDELIN